MVDEVKVVEEIYKLIEQLAKKNAGGTQLPRIAPFNLSSLRDGLSEQAYVDPFDLKEKLDEIIDLVNHHSSILESL